MKSVDPVRLLRSYRQRGVLIDSNLLLLYVVGLVDPQLIERFQRTRNLTRSDFDLLEHVLKPIKRIATTPNILTDVGNLGDQFDGTRKDRFRRELARTVGRLHEHYAPSRAAVDQPVFGHVGLADAATMVAARNRFCRVDAGRRPGVATEQTRD